MRKNLLLVLMILVTLLTVAGLLVSVHAFRAQEQAMDAMMRSYVLDLAENFAGGTAAGRGMSQRNRPMGPMRFRMLSMDPALRNGGAGGVLLIGTDGRIAAGSPGAERLLFLVNEPNLSEEPRKVRDSVGNDYYVVMRRLEDGSHILAAVSRTALLAPLVGIWNFWIVSAMGTSAAVLVGMLLLWRFLAVPLRGIVEKIRGMQWGKDRSTALYRGPISELDALSRVIGTLAEEAYAKEELKHRYVTDLVLVEEQTRRHLARELHDGPLQSSVAAIKRIQLAKEVLPGDGGEAVRLHLDTAENVVQTAVKEIRDYCDELSPSWIRLGLPSAMHENADRLSRAYHGVVIDVDVDEAPETLPEEHSIALIRIFQEAVSNAVRHGKARFIQSELRQEGSTIHFSIRDDGAGFDAETFSGTDYEVLRTTGHRGLANMNERARLLGGVMTLDSAPGKGCRIDIVFPLSSEKEDNSRNG